MSEQPKIPALMSRFKVVGELEETKEESYGSDGKTLAKARLTSQVTDFEGDPVPCEVELTLFGGKRDKILNAGIGTIIEATGSIQFRAGKSGALFPNLTVEKLAIHGNPKAPSTPTQSRDNDLAQHSMREQERAAEAAEEAELMF